MRIITGSARGRKLKTPKNTDIRPTSDSVKESIFSAIQFNIEGAVAADLFAGTGQIGIEALSRGASRVYFSDNSPESVAVIRENLRLCGFSDNAEVSPLSAAAFLKKTTAIFDIAFLDPPYGQDLVNRILKDDGLISKMSENGLIICEYEKGASLSASYGNFIIRKTYPHGKKCITIYEAI
ncbi:MAG: 16S rRNA (guanine(966)-N(2))-methyltransferase RsmD [Oscillospiraceae bacterium]|nr:16S rRNA (guanine(966)-N(2))-methyltransferase RsmD [Oscillospiraceae bacterium]